ncbi:hypothetical protein [uncultured Helicobacter sp.]
MKCVLKSPRCGCMWLEEVLAMCLDSLFVVESKSTSDTTSI